MADAVGEAAVGEAMRRAGVVWVNAGGRVTAAWVLWRDGAAYLVTGPGEQPAPGLAAAATAEVTAVAADGFPLTWRAAVSRVPPGGAVWHQVVPALVARRLNLPDAEDTATRWAATCVLLELRPAGAPPRPLAGPDR